MKKKKENDNNPSVIKKILKRQHFYTVSEILLTIVHGRLVI